MAPTLREQLSAYPIPRLTTVLRVDFGLRETPATFPQAMRLIAEWWNEKAKPYGQRIDPETSDLSFARDGFKAEFARTETQFALAMQEPDSSVPDRTWIWDFALALHEGHPQFAVRGSFRQPQNSSQHPDPRAPRFLADLVDNIGALDRDPLESKARLLDLKSLPSLMDLVESDRRTLPVVVVSEDGKTGEVTTDPDSLARILAGTAHVVRLDRQSSWELSAKWEPEWSTYQGAVRCYNPLFNRSGDKFKHKLWLAEAIRRLDANAKNGFLNSCVRHVFTIVTAQFEPFALLSPSDVRRGAQVETPPALETPAPAPFSEEKAVPEDTGSEALEPSILSLAPPLEPNAYEEMASRLRKREEEFQSLADALQQERAGRAELEKELAETKEYGGLWEKEVQDLKRERDFALGDYESEPSEALKPLWQDWFTFFKSLENTATQFRRMERDSALKEELSYELEEAKKEIHNLKATIESMQRGQPGVASQIDATGEADWREAMRTLLPSLREENPSLLASLSLIELIFPERVHVLPGAVKSARKSSAFRHGARAFDLLWRLATDYWESIQEGNGDAEARKVFGQNAYAAREADLSNPGRARRTFEYRGEPVLMEKHLKIGTADNLAETLRVHFEWMSDEKIIVVGYCGGHLSF